MLVELPGSTTSHRLRKPPRVLRRPASVNSKTSSRRIQIRGRWRGALIAAPNCFARSSPAHLSWRDFDVQVRRASDRPAPAARRPLRQSAAATPTHSTTTGTYTLADAISDYENFDVYDGDCGDFVLLVDFEVVRDVTTWTDREDPPRALRGSFLQRLGHVQADRPQR